MAFYSCNNCRNQIALPDDLLSKSFWVKSGKAYYFSRAMNIVERQKEENQMFLSGEFSIAEVYCSKCGEELAMKYLRAYHETQIFKEGKFILESAKIMMEN
ncbi:hypothetical protein LguiA_024215 [Lonicera macranthoides]